MISPKHASRITLVPNREILHIKVAQSLMANPGQSAMPASPLFIFSTWVEEAAVRMRQLLGINVPRSLDSRAALHAWARHSEQGAVASASGLAAARKAQAADRLLRQWVSDDEPPWLDPVFYRWRQRVRAVFQRQGMVSAEDWTTELTARLEDAAPWPFALPEEIELQGFVEFTPLEQRLLGALERRAVAVRFAKPPCGNAEVGLVTLATPEDEWRAAAHWASERLKTGARRVCVVVPPPALRSAVARRHLCQVFSAAFHAAQAARLDDTGSWSFHIAEAARLADSGMIRDALMLLRIALRGPDEALSFPEISRCLLSPHWAGAHTESIPRARLELRLRERDVFRWSLNDVCRHADSATTPVLIETLQGLPSGWPAERAGEWLHTTLRHWGWPGTAAGNQRVAQARQFFDLCERIAGLEFASHGEAMVLLESFCLETSMPFGGGALSPVQVLSPEVAAGGSFDAIWVCHLDDANWPPAIRSNPFLPGKSREAIPRENPEGQLAYFRQLTNMLQAVAPEVRLSWSRDGGEGPRSASPLTATTPAVEYEAVAPARPATAVWKEAVFAQDASRLELVEDHCGIPYPAEGVVEVPGGADFFRLQAACPLAAYVRWRLGASFVEMPGPFASPLYHGILMHHAIQLLYQPCVGGGQLPEKGAVATAVSRALERSGGRRRLGETGLLAEAGRLERALTEWLETDRGRSGFSIHALETGLNSCLGRAQVSVRIDRLDRLADGRLFLIDYKSGKGNRRRATQWVQDRIQEPQLPLYAALMASEGDDPAGIAIGVVKAGDCAFDGISDNSAAIADGLLRPGQGRPRIAFPDWQALMAHWQGQAEMLSQEILAGHAANRVFDAAAVEFSGLGPVLRHVDDL